jgi:diamine N-acetyltransferase
MTLEFREVTEENFEEFVTLEVSPEQKENFYFRRADPNLWSLAQTYIFKGARILALYDGDTMVGSMFYSRDDTNPSNFWLIRFMIDQRYQGKGYGRQAMLMLFDRVKAENNGEPAIMGLCYEHYNKVGENLYRSLGFEPSGETMGGGQIVARKSLSPDVIVPSGEQ